MIILADSTGAELRAVKFLEYDFEVGDFENSFLVTGNRSEWEAIPDKARIYIPGTEYGGVIRAISGNTKEDQIQITGNHNYVNERPVLIMPQTPENSMRS